MESIKSFFPAWVSESDAGLFIVWLMVALALVAAQYGLKRYAQHKESSRLLRVAKVTIRPFFATVCLLLAQSAVHLIPESRLQDVLNHGLNVLLITTIAWWIIAAARAVKDATLRYYDVSVADNYHARQVHTRLSVLFRIFAFFVWLLAFAFMLMTFEGVRTLGTSLLAGAGVTGIILGLAAQKTLGSIFAGIQIALTQPIKIDDAVVIEGEWGWIEEITLTYVVVRIWDLRRLIVPITYFVDKPIQNWTRREAEIIGSVFIYADYTLDVEGMRAELQRLAEASPHWNKRVCVLQITDVSERTMTLRALVTAHNSPTAWDLRCEIREGLINWMRQHAPDSFPRTRIGFGPDAAEAFRPAERGEAEKPVPATPRSGTKH